MSGSEEHLRKVFVSFASEDLAQVDPILASTQFSSVYFNEQERKYIQANGRENARVSIAERLLQTTITVCLLGVFTYTSSWVEWELEASRRHGRPVIAMGLKGGPESLSLPYGLLRQTWYGWDYKKLCRLINKN